MNRTTMIKAAVPALLIILLAAGCASSKNSGEPVEDAFNVESVDVMVEGRHRGVTPATVEVVRSRGEYDVFLMKGETVVRHFEIGHGGDQRSPERHIMNMDLERDLSGMGYRTFDLGDLDSPNDTLYIIPYTSQRIAIDDREYGLTLIVSN